MIEILVTLLFGFALGVCTVRLVDSIGNNKQAFKDRPTNKVYPTKPWPPPPEV